MQRISENQLISGTWTPSFYGYDGHGSVRFLTNSASSVTDTYEYDAFGNLIASTGSTPNNYLFSGEQFDPALGIYQMRARWYRQPNGRFLTMDPFPGTRYLPLTLHKYVYTANDPVNGVDPTGYADEEIEYPLITFRSLHIARHLLGLGISQAEVEAAATTAIRAIYAGGGSILGWFSVNLNVGGVSLIARAFPIAVGDVVKQIIVGTIFRGP